MVYVASSEMTPAYRKSVFDHLADSYAQLTTESLNLAIYHHIFATLQSSDCPARWLDFGCGTGLGSSAFSEYSVDTPDVALLGYDVSTSMISRMSNNGTRKYAGIVVGDGENLPFATGTFDATILVFVAHLLTEAATNELFRVLKPGGTLAFNMFKPQSHRKPYRQLTRHDQVLSLQEETARISSGFRRVQVRLVYLIKR